MQKKIKFFILCLVVLLFLLFVTSKQQKSQFSFVYNLPYPLLLETAPKELNAIEIYDVKDALLSLIKSAEKTIDIAALYWTSGLGRPIKQALRAATKRGVFVRFLLNDSEFARNEFQKLKLKQNYAVRFLNIASLGKREYGQVHLKCIIVDNKYSILGSANFSFSALNYNREINILINDAANLARVKEIFERDWKTAELSSKIFPTKEALTNKALIELFKKEVSKIEFSPFKENQNLDTYIVETAPAELNNPYIPDIHQELKNLINSATESIKIQIYLYTSVYTNYPILQNLLFDAKKRNVRIDFLVNGVTYDELVSKTNYKNPMMRQAVKELLEKNISVKKLEIDKFVDRGILDIILGKQFITMHSKFIIVDDKLCMLGSNNWTKSGFHENREIGVVSKNPEIIKALIQVFERDFNSRHTKPIQLENLQIYRLPRGCQI